MTNIIITMGGDIPHNNQEPQILIGYCSGDTLLTIKDFMGNKDNFERIKNQTSNPVYVEFNADLSGVKIPTVGIAIDSNDNHFEVSRYHEMMLAAIDNSNEGLLNDIRAVFLNEGLTGDQVDKLIEDYKDYNIAIQSQLFRIDKAQLPFSEADIVISQINKDTKAPKKQEVRIGESDEPMKEPTDLLNFKLSRNNSIKSYYDKVLTGNDNQPNEDDVDSGDEEELARQREKARKYFASLQTEDVHFTYFPNLIEPHKDKPLLNYVEWNKHINIKYNGYDPRMVTGFNEANELPIQPNEEQIYNAMVELINEGIKEEYGLTTDEEVQEKVNAGILPRHLDTYFTKLIQIALNVTREHTGMVIAVENIEKDDNEDQFESEVQALGWSAKDVDGTKYSVSPATISSDIISDITSSMISLKNYIRRTENSYSYAEALIKLLRWGERKPRMLYLDNSEHLTQKYFDLEKFKAIDFDGDHSKLTPKVVDGADKRITMLLQMNTTITGENKDVLTSKGYGQMYEGFEVVDTIVGVEILREFEDSDVTLTQIVDLKTLSEMIKKQTDGTKIAGTDYIDGKFFISEKVYDQLGFTLNTDGGRALLSPKTMIQIREAKTSISNALSNPEEIKFQPSRQTIEFLNELDVEMPSSRFNQQVSLIPIWEQFVHSTDLESVFEYQEANDESEIKELAMEDHLSFEQALIRKCISEVGDSILALNDLTATLTNDGEINSTRIPLADYLNEAQHMFEKPKKEENQPASTNTGDVSFQGAKDRLTSIDLIPETKPELVVAEIKVEGTVIGYISTVKPSVVYHSEDLTEYKLIVSQTVDGIYFESIYKLFAKKDKHITDNYDYSKSIPGLNKVLVDYKRLTGK